MQIVNEPEVITTESKIEQIFAAANFPQGGTLVEMCSRSSYIIFFFLDLYMYCFNPHHKKMSSFQQNLNKTKSFLLLLPPTAIKIISNEP